MKLNMSKINFLMLMLISMIMMISSNNIMFSWLIMEINMILFMPIMSKSKQMNEQIMKYFIIQSMASSLIMLTMTTDILLEINYNNSIIIMLSMIMKLGLMPMHLWMPMIMNSMNWNNCLIMMTIQKIIPSMITWQMLDLKSIYYPMYISMIIAPIIAMKQSSVKKLLSYSSIANTPIMLLAIYQSITIFSMFMFMYSTINFMIMKKMKEMNIIFLNQMKLMKKNQKISMMIIMLSMSGMPPMMMFMPKWIIIQSEITYSITMTISMILSSILSTLLYMKFLLNSMMQQMSNKNINSKNNSITKISMMNILSTPMIMMLKQI